MSVKSLSCIIPVKVNFNQLLRYLKRVYGAWQWVFQSVKTFFKEDEIEADVR